MIHLSVDSLMLVTMACAGALAFWAFFRFPNAGPHSVFWGLFHLIASLAVAQVCLQLIQLAAPLPAIGLIVAVLAFILAPLTYMTISAMWLLRLATGSTLGTGLR